MRLTLWFALALASLTVLCEAQTLNVTLLGTGTPEPSIVRFGPSTLVEAGTEKLLFDAGRGASQRLWQLKIPFRQITGLFITHLHSDHTVGIPDLWLTGWLPAPHGGRTTPLPAFGPQGTEAMMTSLRQAFQWDIGARTRGPAHLPESGIAIIAKDITQGVIYEHNGVKVTAFDVDHGGHLKPAFGYRVDYAGRSVVISGDTRPNENLVKFARQADLLVHEVTIVRPELLSRSEIARGILALHTSPEDAGKLFERIKPRLAVYNHINLLAIDASIPPPTIEDLNVRTRTSYSGPFEVGEDLMRIEIGEKVEVHKFESGW
jgi:ribonuclease Z